MNIRTLRNRLSVAAATTALSLMTVQVVSAADWNFTDTPLFLSASVKPNLIMAIDDSGSMDGELLIRGNDGMAWWRTAAAGTCTAPAVSPYNFTGCVTNATGTADIPGAGRLNFNYAGGASATWKKFIYLFPNGSGGNTQDMRRYTDATDDHYAVPPLPIYAWSRSPEVNRAYFDPTETYDPWVSTVAPNVFTAATPTATRWDPVFTGSALATVNLKNDLAGNSNPTRPDISTGATSCSAIGNGTAAANWGFRVYTGMTIPVGTCIRVPTMRRNGLAVAPYNQADRATPANWEEVSGPCSVVVPAATGATVKANISCVTKNSVTNVANQDFQLATNNTIWIRYFPATFYLTSTSLLPTNYGWIGSTTPSGTNVDGTVNLIRFEIKRENFDTDAHYNAALQNFANWFQFYRKRHLALRAGLGSAFNTLTGTRVAGFTINAADGSGAPPTGPNVTMGDIDVAADRNALYNNFYRNWTGNGGTPNRPGVYNIIRNFKRDRAVDANAPITNSCQRNFGMLFTDGFSNVPSANDGITAVGNADGAAGAPYQDTFAGSMADATYAAYTTPLRPSTSFPLGKVLKPSACSSASPDPKLDCNDDLHMNFYAITLGTRGLLFDPPESPPDPYVTSQAWPTSFQARHPSAVDDIWHATINGRGQLLNAASSSELGTKLSAVLRSIIERVGSASSAAVNSGSINSDTRLFQASFDSKDWSGKLTGRRVNVDGTLGTEVLATLPEADDRQIITVGDSGPAAFTWDTIGTNRQNELKAGGTDAQGQARLSWIRGSQDAEDDPAPNNLRARTQILGDIINSAPAYVGVPNLRYSDTLEAGKYSEFRDAQKDRIHMVYAGGNDGMLHAFSSDDDDESGEGAIVETFAFIPSMVFKNLELLTSPTYSHHYYVDGTPSTGDAYFDDAWHTMLVGGLNKGGQEVYALDITNPEDFSESNAASIVQWEFTDANDADLGYTYSRPSIIRTNYATTRWMAGFGNGYNNMTADDHISTSGNAVLFLVNMETGALIKKIDTGVGKAQDPYHLLAVNKRPNGLSTPVFIDADGDRDVDYAYAGDLFGNLWKFDLTSDDPTNWHVSNAAPLFTAINGDNKHQPITSRPNVSRGPKGVGYAVVFGTGKYLEADDTALATLDKQSFYGLLDPNTGTAADVVSGRGVLQVQTILKEEYNVPFVETLRNADGTIQKDAAGNPITETHRANIRVLSDNALDANDRGWYMDLVSPAKGFEGEMQVTDSLIRNDHVLFTTLVPNTDPCEFGGTSWLMEMNLFTGARSAKTPWDLNDDGTFDDGDLYHDDNGTTGNTSDDRDWPVGGIQTEVGITPKPATLSSPEANCDYLIFPGTSGGTESRCRDPGPRGFGRQSWRQAH